MLVEPMPPGGRGVPRPAPAINRFAPLPEGPIEDPFAVVEEEEVPLEKLPESEPPVAVYSLENPVARNVFSNAQGSAESLYDGFGGIPSPLDQALLPKRRPRETRGFRVGPIGLRPGLTAGGVFTRTDDPQNSGATLSPESGTGPESTSGAGTRSASGTGSGSQEENAFRTTFIGSLEAVLGDIETGRFLVMDYGLAYSFSSDDSEEEESPIDQRVFLAGQLEFGRLKLGLGIDFVGLSGYSRDAGSNVQRDLLTVALTSTVQLTPKTSFDWDLATPNGRYPDSGRTGATVASSTGFSSTNFLNYEYSPKTKFGLGFTAGILEIEDAETQTFEQMLVRVASVPTPFLNYTGTLGLELRESGGARTTHPIFVLGATWTPRERTAITVTGQQRVQNSSTATDSNFISTTFVLSLSQRLGKRMSLGLSGGFENAKYESVTTGDDMGREERSYLGQLTFKTTLGERWDVGATLSYIRTVSDEPAVTISQFSVQASYQF